MILLRELQEINHPNFWTCLTPPSPSAPSAPSAPPTMGRFLFGSPLFGGRDRR
ncbi:MAG: hypothetical protein F6K41_13535 [Symploca sp. SIO3E6]|nr:hypothetical protein [Caldora sp. SIO3E6]